MRASDEVDDLVLRAYQCVVGRSTWDEVLAQTLRRFDAHCGVMMSVSDAPQDGCIALHPGLSRSDVIGYLQRRESVDVLYHALLRRCGQLVRGVHWRSETLLDDATLRRSELWADYFVPFDVERTMGAVLTDQRAPGRQTVLINLFRPTGRGPFDADEERAFHRLWPHLSQALEVAACQRDALKQLTAAAGLQAFAKPQLALSTSRRIIWANGAAERLMQQCGLALHGVLRTCDGGQEDALTAAVDACAKEAAHPSACAWVRLGGLPGRGIVARVYPVGEGGVPGAVAWVTLAQEGLIDPSPLQGIIPLYGLTKTEARVLAALCEGHTIKDIATERQVGLDTVRTHVRSVMAKTGTHRQADLIRLMATLAR